MTYLRPSRSGTMRPELQHHFCILFVGHGSRDPQANTYFQDTILSFQRRNPDVNIFGAYIELADPPYAQVLEELSLRFLHIRVVPFTLFAAGHVKNDLPYTVENLRRRFPAVTYEICEALGTDPQWVSYIHRHAKAWDLDEDGTVLLAIGRGSSDAGANSAFYHMARLIAEGMGLRHVLPAFVGITKPDYRESLRQIVRQRPQKLLVLPYFLYTGVLHQRLQTEIQNFRDRYPSIEVFELPPLSDIEGFQDIIAHRAFADDEGQGSHLLPCHSCQYRVPLGGLEGQVGGLNSLLYSIRHSLTRQQATPHVHAHAPIAKHIFICTNRDCADRGALRLARSLRRHIKDRQQSLRWKVTLTSCMGRCGEGPAIAVYPDGIWYRQMDDAGIEQLVEKHLSQDSIVEAYVDTIL